MAVALVTPIRAQTLGRRQLHSQGVAEFGRNLFKLNDLLSLRLFVDTIERRNLAALKIPGHGLVGGQHEFFNQAMGKVPFRARNAHHAA